MTEQEIQSIVREIIAVSKMAEKREYLENKIISAIANDIVYSRSTDGLNAAFHAALNHNPTLAKKITRIINVICGTYETQENDKGETLYKTSETPLLNFYRDINNWTISVFYMRRDEVGKCLWQEILANREQIKNIRISDMRIVDKFPEKISPEQKMINKIVNIAVNIAKAQKRLGGKEKYADMLNVAQYICATFGQEISTINSKDFKILSATCGLNGKPKENII